MLVKAESDNKILVQRINYDKKTVEAAKKAEGQNIGGCF
jgi:hypothetical protein